MRTSLRSSGLLLLVAACARNPSAEQVSPQPARPVPGVATAAESRTGGPAGTLAGFVAQVAPATGEAEAAGECREYTLSAADGPRRTIMYTIGTGPVQVRASLQVDSAGKRLSYSEMRGDLQINSSAPATSIVLNFVRGTAQASNEGPGGLEVANGSLGEAMQAANLGTPQRLVELIERRCMTH